MGKDHRYGGEPLLLLAAAVAAELGHGKNSRELFEMGKFLNLIKENLYVLADQRLNWPEPIKKLEKAMEKDVEKDLGKQLLNNAEEEKKGNGKP